MSLNLSRKQLNVLRTLQSHCDDRGYMPSVRELAASLGISPATTQQHLNALRKKGFLASNGRAHGLQLLKRVPPAQPMPEEEPVELPAHSIQVPIVGRIAAGRPIEAVEISQDLVDVSLAMARRGDYLLQVEGRSMIEDGIFDGDLVLIRPQEQVENGQIAVALLEDGSATLKRIYKEDGRVRLQPANSEMQPFYADDVRLQGRVVGLLRSYN